MAACYGAVDIGLCQRLLILGKQVSRLEPLICFLLCRLSLCRYLVCQLHLSLWRIISDPRHPVTNPQSNRPTPRRRRPPPTIVPSPRFPTRSPRHPESPLQLAQALPRGHSSSDPTDRSPQAANARHSNSTQAAPGEDLTPATSPHWAQGTCHQ